MGYQKGAIQAIVEAENQGWIKDYDWVIRVNLDVIIRNDTWLLIQMHNTHVNGIFVDCFSRACSQKCVQNVVHSDFFAFRPKAMPDGRFEYARKRMNGNAERHATLAFREIVTSGTDAWLPNSRQKGFCRVIHSDVIHIHDHKQC